MSDTFDHMNDAFDRYWNGDEYSYSNRNIRSSFNYDPLYYHNHLPYKNYKKISDKCFRFLLENGYEINIPEKVIRFRDDKCFVHYKFYEEYVSKVERKRDKLVNKGSSRNIKMIPWEEAQNYL